MITTNLIYLKEKYYTGNMQKAVAYLIQHKDEFITQEAGCYEVCPEFFYMIQEYQTKKSTIWESHKEYIDIQLVLDGEELLEASFVHDLTPLAPYDKEKDFCGFEGQANSIITLFKNDLVIFYPEDAHKPALQSASGACAIKKCLFKVLV